MAGGVDWLTLRFGRPGRALLFHELGMVFRGKRLHAFDHLGMSIGLVVCLRDILAQMIEFVLFPAEREFP